MFFYPLVEIFPPHPQNEAAYYTSSMVCFGEWTAFTDALIILCREVTHDFRFFHFNPKVIFHKIDSRKDGQEGVPLAAARPSDFTDPAKCSGSHLVGQRKRFISQRRGL